MNDIANRRQRLRFLRELRKDLDLLLRDLEAATTEKYLYVIDFAAIYSHVYKTTNITSFDDQGLPDEKRFARDQVALDFIFSGRLEPLLLIPPYAAEFTNHLRTLKQHLVTSIATLKSDDLRARLRAMLEASQEFRDFVTLSHDAIPMSAVDDHIKTAALKLGRQYFPELYSAVLSLRGSGVPRFRELFDLGILHNADEVIPDLKGFDYPKKETDEWYNRIAIRRSFRGRHYQTQIDAMACTYLAAANSLLNNDHKIVLFVAPSLNVREAIEGANLVAGDPLGVVRDLSYFMLSLTHANDPERVRESLKGVEQLVDLYSSPLAVSDAFLESVHQHQKLIGNLSLMTEAPLPSQYSGEQPAADRKLVDVLRTLHDAIETNRPMLQDELVNSLDSLRVAISDLEGSIPSAAGVESEIARLLPQPVTNTMEAVVGEPLASDEAEY
jgi:hypothetical protein